MNLDAICLQELFYNQSLLFLININMSCAPISSSTRKKVFIESKSSGFTIPSRDSIIEIDLSKYFEYLEHLNFLALCMLQDGACYKAVQLHAEKKLQQALHIFRHLANSKFQQ